MKNDLFFFSENLFLSNTVFAIYFLYRVLDFFFFGGGVLTLGKK